MLAFAGPHGGKVPKFVDSLRDGDNSRRGPLPAPARSDSLRIGDPGAAAGSGSGLSNRSGYGATSAPVVQTRRAVSRHGQGAAAVVRTHRRSIGRQQESSCGCRDKPAARTGFPGATARGPGASGACGLRGSGLSNRSGYGATSAPVVQTRRAVSRRGQGCCCGCPDARAVNRASAGVVAGRRDKPGRANTSPRAPPHGEPGRERRDQGSRSGV